MISLCLYNNHESFLDSFPLPELNVSVCENVKDVHYSECPYDAKVEYLRAYSYYDNKWNYGVFYLNFPNIKMRSGYGFGLEAEVTTIKKSTTGWVSICGINWSSNLRCTFFINPSNLYCGLDWQTTGGGNMFQFTSGKHTVEVRKNSSTQAGIYYDNVQKATKNYFTFDNSSFMLFGASTDSAYDVKVYRYWVVDSSGNYILNCIPVRVGTTGYLYDKVSNQIFGNLKSGTFILGPDIN